MSFPNLLGVQQDIFNDGHDINVSNNMYFNSIGPTQVLTTSSTNELKGVALNTSIVPVTDSNGNITSSSTTSTKLSYLNTLRDAGKPALMRCNLSVI